MSDAGDTKLDAELEQGPPAARLEDRAMQDRVAEKLFGDKTGGVFIGRYLVVRRIGAGGMGVVYLARDPKLQRDVALKVLHAQSVGREIDRARLLREGNALARLSHPNVVHLYDVGEHGGSIFLAMEHVEGVQLKEWQAQEHPARDVLDVYLQAGEGLAAAHDAGLVHRDFKPANVIVSRDPLGARSFGRVRVLDFGLAREPGQPGDGGSGSVSPAASSLTSGNITRTGAVLGTPAYMPPEQVRGEPIDARADQFSYCVALWEALYGERPFGDGVPLVMDRPKPPRRLVLPRKAQRALERGLSPRPASRFGQMHELLRELSPHTAARSKVMVAFAGGLVLAAAAGAMAMDGATPQTCEAVSDVADVWSTARRDALHERLSALAKGWDASTSIDTAMSDLDAYAAAWSTARADLCHEQPALSEARHEARRACLERRRRQLADTVEILDAADPDVLARASQLVSGLGAVSECADATEPAEAADPRQAEWLAQVDRAALLYDAGRVADAKSALDELATAMGETAAPRVRGEAAFLRSRIVRQKIGAQAAQDELFAAASFAHASGDDDLAARAWLALAQMKGDQNPTGVAEAERWLALGEASLSRFQPSARLRADALATRATIASARGDHDEAIADFRESLSILKAERPPSAIRIVSASTSLATAYFYADRMDDAETIYRDAMSMALEKLGADHPEVARAEMNLADVARARDERAAMRAHLERARVILERAYGQDAEPLGRILVRLGEMAVQDGAYDEAIEVGRRTAAIQARLPPDDVERGGGLAIVAMAQMGLGRIAEARDTLEELWRELPESNPLDQRLDVLQNLGSMSQQLGEHHVAREWYDRLRDLAPPGSEKAVVARASLAQCDIRLGDTTRGIAILEAMRAAGEQTSESSRAFTAWYLAIGYADHGDPDRARAVAAEVVCPPHVDSPSWNADACDELGRRGLVRSTKAR